MALCDSLVHTALQSHKAVTAYFSNNQLLSFWLCTAAYDIEHTIEYTLYIITNKLSTILRPSQLGYERLDNYRD